MQVNKIKQTIGVFLSIALLFLGGCLETDAPKEKEKLYTVPDILKSEALMEQLRGWCAVNPAERQKHPNCVNFVHAYQMDMAGLLAPCFKNGKLDSECVGALLEKKEIK